MPDTQTTKSSFVHKQRGGDNRKKSWLALLLLLLGRRKAVVALVVAGALVLFLMLAPFGFDMGRFGEFLSRKTGLAWIGRALMAADQWLAAHGLKSDEDAALREMYMARESELGGPKIRAAAGEARDANPESLVDGGKALTAEAKPGEAPPPSAIQPDEARKSDPVVQVDGKTGGDGAKFDMGTALGGAGGPGSMGAFGNAGTFAGNVKVYDKKDNLIKSIPNPMDGVQDPAAPIRTGRLTTARARGFGGSRDSALSSRRALAALGSHYRYRLASASAQTGSATLMADDGAAVWGRAWATGEKVSSGLDGGDGVAPPGTPNPANPNSGTGGGDGGGGAFDSTMDACTKKIADLQEKLKPMTEQQQKDAQTMKSLGAPDNAPDCCDHDKIDKWNATMTEMLAECGKMNDMMSGVQKDCKSVIGTSAMNCDPSQFPQNQKCGDSECCMKSFLNFFGPLKFLVSIIMYCLIPASIIVSILSACGVDTGDYGKATGEAFNGIWGTDSPSDDTNKDNKQKAGAYKDQKPDLGSETYGDGETSKDKQSGQDDAAHRQREAKNQQSINDHPCDFCSMKAAGGPDYQAWLADNQDVVQPTCKGKSCNDK
jgi:hypothetical protein